MRAVRIGVAVGLLLGGEENMAGALLYDVSLRGDAGLDGLFDFLCNSGDCSLGEPIDTTDFFAFSTGFCACILGECSGRSFAWKNLEESGLGDSEELDLLGSGEVVIFPLPT